MYSYSRSKGLFGGASIEGSIIVERSDANSKAYGFNVTAKQLLSGSVELPRWAEELGETIKRRSGRDNRIPGWIEDGDEIATGTGEWNSDEEEEGREVFRSNGLTPREYGEKGYSFGSQYASGGSHQAANSGGGGGGGGGSPNRSRSGSGTSRFLGSLGGRSRSGSSASTTAEGYAGIGKNDTGPVAGDGHNFATKFESDYGEPSARPRSTSSPLRSPPLTKKDFSLIDAQDPFSESNAVSTPPISAATTTSPTLSRPSLFSRMSSSSVSSKLTKSRSGSGTGSALRERAGQMNWSTFDNSSREDVPASESKDRPEVSRDSFDSLDGDTNDSGKSGPQDAVHRKRASTVSGSSNPSDTLSSYHRPPLPSSGGRSRSFTSPFGGGGGAPFSKKNKNKNKKPEYTAYNDPSRREGLYPIHSHDSHSTAEYEFDEPDYATSKNSSGKGMPAAGGGGGRKRGDSNPKPWDSEDEDFLADSVKPVRPSQHSSNLSTNGKSSVGAFDFRQVEADFASVEDGKGLRGRSGTITTAADTTQGNGRSRSGTLTAQTSSKGAIGTAIARYDFKGVEVSRTCFLLLRSRACAGQVD